MSPVPHGWVGVAGGKSGRQVLAGKLGRGDGGRPGGPGMNADVRNPSCYPETNTGKNPFSCPGLDPGACAPKPGSLQCKCTRALGSWSLSGAPSSLDSPDLMNHQIHRSVGLALLHLP